MHTQLHSGAAGFELILVLLLVLVFLIYLSAAIVSSQKYKEWPWYRYMFWALGLLCITLTFTGPLATYAQNNFVGHMIGHLLLGMLAPLFVVLAMPMTLLLRTINRSLARKVSKVLRSSPIQFLSNPIVAAVLNIGGLYVLYTTSLYSVMHQSLLVYIFVHIHVFLAGYLFTISIVYVDVTSHRYSYLYRSIVLVLALAGHKILSKYIYVYPPEGVPRNEAEAGGKWMYYGVDIVDLVLIIILCFQWFKSTAPRLVRQPNDLS
ncbi:cytochrome c oxidase assembly protein [Planococcus plakortidis]|uniref:cytochrome c oxidase assembly protein n=1 Tax=Planococcus plakortidis TaxID=1038856 RepID=UPI00385C41A3